MRENALEGSERQLQRSANRRALGLVNFGPAFVYHFCLALPAAITQPSPRLLAEPCTTNGGAKMTILIITPPFD